MSGGLQTLTSPELHRVGNINSINKSHLRSKTYKIVSLIGVASSHELLDWTWSPPTSSWNLSLDEQKKVWDTIVWYFQNQYVHRRQGHFHEYHLDRDLVNNKEISEYRPRLYVVLWNNQAATTVSMQHVEGVHLEPTQKELGLSMLRHNIPFGKIEFPASGRL